MCTLPTSVLLVVLVFAERQLCHGEEATLSKVGRHSRYVGRKDFVKNLEHRGKHKIHKIVNPAASEDGRRSLSIKSQNSKKKKQLKMDTKEVNKILAINNDKEFTNKVFQMMKDDDSDVLKDVDEDENPMIFTNLQSGFHRGKSKSSKRKSSSKEKQITQDSKRSFITQPPFNGTNWHSGFDYNVNSHLTESAQSMQSVQSTQPTQLPQSTQSLSALQQQQPQNSTPIQNSLPVPEPQSHEQMMSQVSSNSAEMVHNKLSKAKDIGYSDKELIMSKASRVCKPGPPLSSNKRLPNCLLIGDSITLSSSYSVAAALETKCTVQMAPFSKGGCALDSRYGLDCIQFLLSTTNLSPTRYDVIVFNFGMHDIDFSNEFPEEFNDEERYKRNLGRIKKILLKTKAGVAFSLTTPVTYNKSKNDLVVKYNKIAKRVMSKRPSIDVIDLYNFVIDNCGEVPFKNCFMMKKPNDVHYGLAGSILLGKQIAAKIAVILKKKNLWVKSGFSLPDSTNFTKPLFTDLKEDSTKCSANVSIPTRCPSDTTCVKNAFSRSGYACCLHENGVDCKDNFHCCPENTTCHKNCSPKWCSCIKR